MIVSTAANLQQNWGGGEKTEVIAVVGQAADLNPLEGLQWRSRRGHMAVLPTDTTLACSATVNE